MIKLKNILLGEQRPYDRSFGNQPQYSYRPSEFTPPSDETPISTTSLKDFTKPNNVASQKLLKHIRDYESLVLFAYDDGVFPSVKFDSTKHKLTKNGTLTIGYGHIEGVKEGDTITKEKANLVLISDVNEKAKCITDWIGRQKIRDADNDTNFHLLTQGMYDALLDVAFNKGCSGLVNNKEIMEDGIESGDKIRAHTAIKNLLGDGKRWEKTAAMFIS